MEKHPIIVELRSETLNQVLAAPPSLIAQSGNILLAITLFFILLLTWLISYSDVVSGSGIISRSTFPVEVFNSRTVQLKNLLISENEQVEKNDILAVFEERVAPTDVSTVSKYLELARTESKLPELPSNSIHFRLGSFTTTWLRYLSSETHSQLENTLLTDKFEKWKQIALLLAPCSGKVIFTDQLQIHKLYSPKELFLVIDPEEGNYIVNGQIDASMASTIRIGQKVIVELVDYKPDEFGVLNGKVKATSQLQKNGKYHVVIELPNQLKTSYRKQLPHRPILEAKIKIITKENRLLLRLINRILN